MVTTEVMGYQSTIFCLSTDEKPIKDIENGSTLVETQPSGGIKAYIFDGENKKWVEI